MDDHAAGDGNNKRCSLRGESHRTRRPAFSRRRCKCARFLYGLRDEERRPVLCSFKRIEGGSAYQKNLLRKSVSASSVLINKAAFYIIIFEFQKEFSCHSSHQHLPNQHPPRLLPPHEPINLEPASSALPFLCIPERPWVVIHGSSCLGVGWGFKIKFEPEMTALMLPAHESGTTRTNQPRCLPRFNGGVRPCPAGHSGWWCNRVVRSY